ncbi:hypothetical protein DL93DRAFT_2167099 [Clavulina sp. PMI_390]|nr:hypothetical protein DL93DRAFT_2167099 [Clavulina sp. PMI_390]
MVITDEHAGQFAEFEKIPDIYMKAPKFPTPDPKFRQDASTSENIFTTEEKDLDLTPEPINTPDEEDQEHPSRSSTSLTQLAEPATTRESPPEMIPRCGTPSVVTASCTPSPLPSPRSSPRPPPYPLPLPERPAKLASPFASSASLVLVLRDATRVVSPGSRYTATTTATAAGVTVDVAAIDVLE